LDIQRKQKKYNLSKIWKRRNHAEATNDKRRRIGRGKSKYPLEKVVSSSMETVADRHRSPAYDNKH